MDEGRTPPAGIKVVDRRRFTDDGTLREGVSSGARSSPPEPAGARHGTEGDGPARPGPARPGPTGHGQATTSPRFVELVAMLAQQAELLLAGAEGIPQDPDRARLFIDYLGVLEEKCRGNLSAEESRILTGILFELRSVVIQGRR